MRILLIEDEEKIAAAIPKLLRADGNAVDVAANGIMGEELAKTNDYDVIILDLMMPVQDGWVTCQHLRRDRVLTPILMLTALGDVSDTIKGFDIGADDYLVKPFHFGELMARLRGLARRKTDVRGAYIEQYGLRLDTNTHHAFRDGKEVTLTAKEFALLELFMTHSGKILSRETIAEYLWDMNFEPRSNVIESFVKFLRQKIDVQGSPKLIHTVRGAGYMFSDTEP